MIAMQHQRALISQAASADIFSTVIYFCSVLLEKDKVRFTNSVWLKSKLLPSLFLFAKPV
jgi:hypothetical protein